MDSRREFLQRFGSGFGLLGLASLLDRQGLLVSPAAAASEGLTLNPLAPRPHIFRPRPRASSGCS